MKTDLQKIRKYSGSFENSIPSHNKSEIFGEISRKILIFKPLFYTQKRFIMTCPDAKQPSTGTSPGENKKKLSNPMKTTDSDLRSQDKHQGRKLLSMPEVPHICEKK